VRGGGYTGGREGKGQHEGDGCGQAKGSTPTRGSTRTRSTTRMREGRGRRGRRAGSAWYAVADGQCVVGGARCVAYGAQYTEDGERQRAARGGAASRGRESVGNRRHAVGSRRAAAWRVGSGQRQRAATAAGTANE
jgi:hypothetical protein